jgi:hypothetical protein
MSKLVTLVALVGCSGSEEAATVVLPVATSASALAPATTDLGYTVQVSEIRIAVSTVQFTIEGETHTDTAKQASSVLPPPHPGHSAGGEVTGELPGDFVLVWNGATQPLLGNGTLIVGDYHGANFAFRAADARDSLPAGDPLIGHTFHVVGSIGKGGTTKPFTAVLDVEPDSEVIGAPFEDVVTEASTETLALEFYPTDPFEGDTPFDGVDFFQLPEAAGAIAIAPGSTAHNISRRAIQTHDHYAVVAQ